MMALFKMSQLSCENFGMVVETLMPRVEQQNARMINYHLEKVPMERV